MTAFATDAYSAVTALIRSDAVSTRDGAGLAIALHAHLYPPNLAHAYRSVGLLTLARIRHDIDCTGPLVAALMPAVGGDTRDTLWSHLCDAADELRDIRDRAGSTDGAREVLDEWHRAYGTDPHAEAMAVADDLERAIDAYVREAAGA